MMIYLISVKNHCHYFYDTIHGKRVMYDETFHNWAEIINNELSHIDDNEYTSKDFVLPEILNNRNHYFESSLERKEILDDILFEYVIKSF